MKNKYQQAVLDVVKLIPKGRVSTYGAIADFLSLGSARMVGWALRSSIKEEEWVPAHRVVNRKGELSGRNAFRDPRYMQVTLEQEGHQVVDHQVQNFDAVYWHPEEFLKKS